MLKINASFRGKILTLLLSSAGFHLSFARLLLSSIQGLAGRLIRKVKR